jgi:hypothetical protein
MNKTKYPTFLTSILIGIILLIFGTMSCKNHSDSQKSTKAEEDHKAVVIKAIDTTIDSENYQIISELLYGKWVESILWIKKSETTRAGIRFIVMHSEYEFQNDGHYSYKQFLRDSITYSYVGTFKLLEEGNKIQLLSNLRNDYEFNDGDTVRRTLQTFHLLNDSILRIEEDALSSQRGTIIEYRRE